MNSKPIILTLMLCLLIPGGLAITWTVAEPKTGNLYPNENITPLSCSEICEQQGLGCAAGYTTKSGIMAGYGLNVQTWTEIRTLNTETSNWLVPSAQSGKNVTWTAACGSGDGAPSNKTWYYIATGFRPPESDFNGTPLTGPLPLAVNLTDASSGNPTSFNWSVSGNNTAYIADSTARNTTVYLPGAGYYNISHGVSNAGGSDIETKTGYIYVYDGNSAVTTGFIAIDATSGYPVNGAQVDLHDIEADTWTNTTTIGGWATIDTLPTHTIDAYANATGYEDADLLAQPTKAGSFYQIMMWPDVGFKNVSEGMVTAYFHVNDANTGEKIPGAMISGGGENYGVLVNSTMFGLTTNAAGMASIAVQNNTNIYITTSKGGYQTATQAFATGPGSGGTDHVIVSISLSKLTVTPTATMTTLPGQPGVYPTTVDPYSLLSPEEKQKSLAGDVLDWAPMLINLFILLTVIGGVKMIAK